MKHPDSARSKCLLTLVCAYARVTLNMTTLVTLSLTRWHTTCSKWREFCAVFRILNRKGELERLAKWAIRKNLPGPRRLYERRIEDEERRLLQYTFRSRRLVRRARFLHWLSGLVKTTPRYVPRGSAAIYRFGRA